MRIKSLLVVGLLIWGIYGCTQNPPMTYGEKSYTDMIKSIPETKNFLVDYIFYSPENISYALLNPQTNELWTIEYINESYRIAIKEKLSPTIVNAVKKCGFTLKNISLAPDNAIKTAEENPQTTNASFETNDSCTPQWIILSDEPKLVPFKISP